MASKYALCALLVVAFIATAVNAGKGKKGKGMYELSCLTDEAAKTMMETKNATMAACKAELGLNSTEITETVGATTTAKPKHEGKHGKPNACFMECYWRQVGLAKDGSFVMDEFVKANVKPEHQEKLKSKVAECFTKEGLSTTYTVNKDDQCKSLEKYGKCMHKSAKVCKENEDDSKEDE